MTQYKIWDGVELITTPSHDVFTPEEWRAKHNFTEDEKIVISKIMYNGGYCDSLTTVLDYYKYNFGVSFDEGLSDEEKIEVINDFEIQRAEEEKQRQEELANQPSVEERTAAALEFLAISSLPDEKEGE